MQQNPPELPRPGPQGLSLGTPRPIRRSLADRRGVSAVEFALILPLLITLLLGAFDLGNAFQQNIRLESAARAAAQAAFSNSAPENMTNIANIVRTNLSGLSNLTIDARVTLYRCDDGTDSSAASLTCATPKIVSITVRRPFTFIGPLTQFLLPNLDPVKGNVEVRLL
jgi:Flp pilus assembly protein TadG